jgi:voltage-gated potassium channel
VPRPIGRRRPLPLRHPGHVPRQSPRYDRVPARPVDYRSRHVRRLGFALGAVAAVLVLGSVGYVVLGMTPLDAAYQTVTTVFTIGFREIVPFDTAVEKIYTMVLIIVGVGTALYTATLVLELVLEGHVTNAWGRRRMQHDIDQLRGHAIVCGFGRVGRAAAGQILTTGQQVVVVDIDEDRLATCTHPHVLGDASRDEVLRLAGIDRAATVVASLDDDSASVYCVLTARSLNPDVFVIARSRTDDAEPKFVRAGANRVVNPQRIGGNRIAAFAESPDVVDFLDVVMHEGGHEFRLVDIRVHHGSPLVGSTVAQIRAQEGGGAMLLALRTAGSFVTNPAAETRLGVDDVLIVVGTARQVDDLHRQAQA